MENVHRISTLIINLAADTSRYKSDLISFYDQIFTYVSHFN